MTSVVRAPDWQSDDGSVRLYRGDCLEVLPEVEADALISDPPYGIDFDTDYTRFTSGFGTPRNTHKPIEGDNKPFDPLPLLRFKRVVLWGGNHFASALPRGSWLVWDKRFKNGRAFLADAELAWMKGGYGAYIYAQTWQGCVRSEKVQHPTQKPIGLMEWCIEKAKTPADGTVADPFMGSGTTGVACVRTGRRFIGVEKEARYFDIARARIEAAIREKSEQLIQA